MFVCETIDNPPSELAPTARKCVDNLPYRPTFMSGWNNFCFLLLLVVAGTQSFGQTLKMNIGSLEFRASDLNYGDCIQVPITFSNTGPDPLVLESYVFTLKITDMDGLLFGGVEGNYLVANGFIPAPGFGITNPASSVTNLLSGTPVPACPMTFNQATRGGSSIAWSSGMADLVLVRNNAEGMAWKRAAVFNGTSPFSLAQIEPGETYLMGVLVFELGFVLPARYIKIETTSVLEDPVGNAYVISPAPFQRRTNKIFDTSAASGFIRIVVDIPDPNLKAFLVANYDTSMDGEISVAEAVVVTEPMICDSLGIADLTGIEEFTHLMGLDVANNNLTVVTDFFTNMLDLNYLDISNNQLDVCDCLDVVAIWMLLQQNGGELQLDFNNCPVGSNLQGWPFSISILDLIPICGSR